MAPAATQRACKVALRCMSEAAKQLSNAVHQATARAHPAPEEAGLTPRQHTAFAPPRPRLHGLLAAVFLPHVRQHPLPQRHRR